MSAIEDLIKNYKKYICLAICAIVVLVVVAILLVNIGKNNKKNNQGDNNTAMESHMDSTSLSDSKADSLENVTSNNETEKNSENESVKEDNAEAAEGQSVQSDKTQTISEDSSDNYYADNSGTSNTFNDNSKNENKSDDSIVYNSDGSLNLQESCWQSYSGFNAFKNAIESSPQFMELVSKAQTMGIPVSSWSLVRKNDKYAPKDETAKDVKYYLYYSGVNYYYLFGYDGSDFYFDKQGFMDIAHVGGYSPEEFENNIVYKEDGTLNLQESYWHYEDRETVYRSITSTSEFKQAINGYKSIILRYPDTTGKMTAKIQQWIVGYPDGSEYHFMFDGSKYCRMPKWNN